MVVRWQRVATAPSMERMVVVISAPRRRRSPPWFGAETRRALAAGFAVAGLTLLAGWPYWRDHPAAAAITLVSCAAIAVVGVLLATGGRTRRTGLLFVAASVFWAVNWTASWNTGVWPLLSLYAQGDFYLALVAGVLLYPGGRLEFPADRAWTVLACLILVGCPTALWTTSRPEWAAVRDSAWWPAPFPDHATYETVLRVCSVLYLVLALSFAVVLLLRLRRMGRLRRLLTLPVTAAIAFVGVSAAVTQGPIMKTSISPDEMFRVYVVQGTVVLIVPLTLLASALRVRLSELTVAGRMLRLTAPVSVERIRDALRDVLHDPTLELWFWAPDEQAYVDTAGRPVDIAPGGTGPRDAENDGDAKNDGDAENDADGSRVGNGDEGRWRREVVTASGEPLAVVELGGALRDHASLVEAALVAGGRALETARLQASVHAGVEQVRSAYRRLVRAEAVERERLARDLHDGAQQRLLALGAMLGTLEAISDDPVVKDHARACRAELREALAELRALAREVQPALLVQDGLGPALEVVAERLGTRVKLHVTPRRFSREIESTLYTALCETLSYAVDRVRASEVLVRVGAEGGRLVAEVECAGAARENGTAGPAVDPAADLAGLSGRIRALHGEMSVDGAPGRGTRVRMDLPCE